MNKYNINKITNRSFYLVFAVAVVMTLAILTLSTSVLAEADTVTTSTDDIFAQVYEDVSPSVVAISVVSRQENTGLPGQDGTVVGGGTGFVLDNEGHIMTNNHVVDGATDIEVSFTDGTLARADIIGLDPDSDLAVIKVDLPAEYLAQLKPTVFGDSSALQIGQSVLAIGSPFGQKWTLTSGIVSALDRSIQGLTDFSIGGVIQTDAAINPGNSGGPLLNLNGEVIGVNSQIISGSRSNAGIGFAVPGNLAQRVASWLIEQGYIEYSYIGISGRDVYLPLIEAFDLPNNTQGIVVAESVAGAPAYRAGLESATFVQTNEPVVSSRSVPMTVDIITAINGEPLSGMSEFISYLAANTEPGDTATLTVLRLSDSGSQELQFDVRLTPRP